MATAFQEFWRLASAHPLAQAVGFAGLAITVSSYFARVTRRVALRQAVASLFWVAHMLLLGAWTGAVVSASSCLRGTVYSRRGVKAWASHPAWPWFFGVLCAGLAAGFGLAKGEGPRLALAVASQAIASHALWTANISRTRALMALYSFLLLFYNLLFGSIPGSACAVANIVAIAAATIRDRKWRT